MLGAIAHGQKNPRLGLEGLLAEINEPQGGSEWALENQAKPKMTQNCVYVFFQERVHSFHQILKVQDF